MEKLEVIFAYTLDEIVSISNCAEGDEYYLKADADKVIAELKENHKKEIAQLQMEISGLKKSVEVANKVIKQKGGFTIKDIKFGGVKLEGMKCTTQSRK